MKKGYLFLLLISLMSFKVQLPANKTHFKIIAYYDGNSAQIDEYPIEKIDRIIYSFCHLRGNRLSVDNDADSLTIRKLVSLKATYPKLKVLLSLGGWGACKPCSAVFSTETGRKEFAASTKELTGYFHTDGIDLDWEYPGIEGYPGHQYLPEDKQNFTLLIKELRKSLGKKHEISFAAGGFKEYFAGSVEWDKVMPLVSYVNLMTYDLVGGYSKVTGHHTPLYSTPEQERSIDYAIHYLDSIGVPRNKMVIGSAFYGRSWKNVENINHGLYQQGVFKSFIPYKTFSKQLNPDSGYIFYRDPVAKAPYAYSASKKIFATYDDSISIRLKTEYAIKNKLYGIMFWELTNDKPVDGLLDVMYATKKNDDAQ